MNIKIQINSKKNDQIKTKIPKKRTLDKERSARFMLRFVHGSKFKALKGLEFRLVQNMKELRQAAAIVYNEYIKISYVKERPDHMKFILPQITVGGKTFVAIYKGRVLATATLVKDSPMGLPMEKNRDTLLDHYRRKGRRLAEITMLAVDNTLLNQSSSVSKQDRIYLLMNLFKSMMDFNRIQGFSDSWIVCVLKKHDFMYDNLHFDLVADSKPYQFETTHTMELTTRFLDITHQLQHATPSYRSFFEFERSPKELEGAGLRKDRFRPSLEDMYSIMMNIRRSYDIRPSRPRERPWVDNKAA